ncbi:MAG: hypothetical protein JW810_05545 [Sedimentisphaerales bacterium]|nr:hypothetical protein [Sedimentisphaerales bacterium]
MSITTIDQRQLGAGQIARIDIPAEELEAGLLELFRRIELQVGSIENPRPIIQDYLPMVREGLYYSGYSSIRRLQLNRCTVDVDIYFRIDAEPPVLQIDAYLDGSPQPAITLANYYHVQAI